MTIVPVVEASDPQKEDIYAGVLEREATLNDFIAEHIRKPAFDIPWLNPRK
jgi:hypothetical protein